MANEIVQAFNKGSTLYGRVFNSTGQVWNTAGTPAFENWNDANVTDYDIALTDKSSGQYIGSYPTTAAGQYKVNVYKQVGASPAVTDTVVGTGSMNWTGSAESVIEVNVDAILVDTGTTLNDKIDVIDGNVDSILTDTGTTLQGNITDILADTNEIQGKLPTNYIMGSSDQTDKDDEIDDIKTAVYGVLNIYDET